MPLYTINKFFWWMSNDDYAWSAGMVFDAKNVDLSSSKWVKLSRSQWFDSPNLLFTQAQWRPIALLEWQSFTNRLIASRNAILKNFINNEFDISDKLWSIANMTSYSIWNNEYGLIFWNLWNTAKLYFWQMNTSALDLWIWTNWANLVDSLISLPNDVNGDSSTFKEKCPIIIKWGSIFLPAWNWPAHNVYKINILTTSFPPTFTASLDFLALDRWYDVRYLTSIWDQIIVYTSNWDHWKQYFWNGIDNAPERVIDWYDRPILWGATINNIDYVLTWTFRKRELYQVQWYQAQKLFETDVAVKNQWEAKFFFDTENWWSNLIETIWDTLVLPAQTYFYKFWNNKIGLPKNLSRVRLWGFTNLIHYNDKNSDRLIICSQTSGYNWTFGYYIADSNIWEPSQTANTYSTRFIWKIEWLKYDWGSYWIKKAWVKCKVWYDLPLRLWTDSIWDNWINVYAKIDDWVEYFNFYTYVYNNWNYTTKPEIWDIYRVNNQDFEIYDITDKNRLETNWDLIEEKNQWLILHTKCLNKIYSATQAWINEWILVKQSWVWDNEIRFFELDEWYELIKKIRAINEEDRNTKEKTFMFNKHFHQIQFKFDLFTTQRSLTPVLYDSYFQYNIIKNDLWN